MRPINFTSVHDYLDLLFEGVTPSNEDIIKAKREYWRAYNTDLKRRKRKACPTFQISFSKDELVIIKSKLEKDGCVSRYIHDLVLQHLQGNIEYTQKVNTALIEQQLFLIAEYLKELLDFESIDTEKVEALEQYIQVLETVIQESLL